MLVPVEAHGDIVHLMPSSYGKQSFVFDLRAVEAETIEAAWLKPGGRSVGLRRVRSATRRGKLRVRREEFRPRPPSGLGPKRLRRYRLVLRRNTHLPDAQPPSAQDSRPQFFSPSSFWNSPLAPDAPLDPSSAALSAQLRDMAIQEAATGPGPWIETNRFTTPLYTVPADQPTVRVELLNGTVGWRQSLQAAFDAVPIPPGARPAAGIEGQMTIWQPAADKLWEFWQASKDAQGDWHAGYGGAMQNVSKSPGYYTSDSWLGAAYEYRWGATPSGLPAIGGTILLEELARGRIDHALAMIIPQARAGEFSWPAQRTDGSLDSPDAIPYGARFRLDPDLDIASLQLPPLVRMMAEAVQRYGMVVRDQTGAGIGFLAEDTSLLGAADPFWTTGGTPRSDGYLQGLWPHQLMARFPWGHLQLLRMTLCSASGETCPWPR